MPRYQVTDQDTNEVLYVMPDEQACQKQVCISAKAGRATELHFYLEKQAIKARVVTSKGDYNYIIEPYVKPLKQPALRVQPKPTNPVNPLAWRGKPSADGWLAVNTVSADMPSLDHLTPPPRENLSAKKLNILAPLIKPVFARWQMACITVPLNGGEPETQQLGDVLLLPKEARQNGCIAAAKLLVAPSATPAAQYLVGRDAANTHWQIVAKRYSSLVD
jgi:hypothetical protein